MKQQNVVVTEQMHANTMRNGIVTTKGQGMALLEVLIAMLVFALAVLPLVKLQLMSNEATMAGYYKTETSSLAQSLMEVIQKNKAQVAAGAWNGISIFAGKNCKSGSSEEKLACNILNSGDSPIHSPKNAVICIKTKKAENTTTINDDKDTFTFSPVDAYQVDLYAIWYAGKRNKKSYNEDLDSSICDGLTVNAIKKDYLSQDNLDAIVFKQVI